MQNLIKAAVIGDPISHSLSPKLHSFLLNKYKINGKYEAILVKENELEQKVKTLVLEGYSGFNVTIPHKEAIFKLCHQTSQKALLCRAVNTVTINNGQLFGDNSDVEGFINNLKKSYPFENFKNKTAFLIGAGGAARAIIYSLINENFANIIITNRNFEKAYELINDFKQFAAQNNVNLKFLAKEDFSKNLFNCDLLINSTSLGMIGQMALELNLSNLKPSAIVYDIVYKPLMTKILLDAQKQGNRIVTGIGMLAFQAAIGFESWFKQKPQIGDDLINYLISLSNE